MPSTKKLPSGSWRCRISVGKDSSGKYIYKSFTAETKKEAERLAYEYTESHADLIDKKLTLRQAMRSYIDSKSAVLSPTTIRLYDGIWKNHLQSIMEIPIHQLTQSSIQTAINEECKGVPVEHCGRTKVSAPSPKTIRNIHGLLSATLAMFFPEMRINTTLPQKVKPQIVIPSDEEIALMKKAAPEYGIELPFCLAAFLGLRRSEICALDLSTDVDFDKGIVTINKAKVMSSNKEWIIKATKTTESTRKLSPPRFVLNLLHEAFDRKEYTVSLSPNLVGDRFRAMQKKLGISPIYRFHDLRHYFASTLLELGVPDKYAMAMMGHNSDRMLKLVYQHLKSQKETDVADLVKAHFEKNYDTNYDTKI